MKEKPNIGAAHMKIRFPPWFTSEKRLKLADNPPHINFRSTKMARKSTFSLLRWRLLPVFGVKPSLFDREPHKSRGVEVFSEINAHLINSFPTAYARKLKTYAQAFGVLCTHAGVF
jgi:hypothetical protein